jgi:hypothetical protein
VHAALVAEDGHRAPGRHERLAGREVSGSETRKVFDGEASTAAFGRRIMPIRPNSSAPVIVQSDVRPSQSRREIGSGSSRERGAVVTPSCRPPRGAVGDALHRDGLDRAAHDARRAPDAAVFVLEDRGVRREVDALAEQFVDGPPSSGVRVISLSGTSFRQSVGQTSTQPPQSTHAAAVEDGRHAAVEAARRLAHRVPSVVAELDLGLGMRRRSCGSASGTGTRRIDS